VRQIPSGAVLHTESAGELIGAHSLFRFRDERDGEEPLGER
jgi:hypothetical protein